MAADKKRLNVEFKSIPETLEEPFLKEFPEYVEGLVRGDPGGFVLTPHYGEHAEELYNFHVRPDDIWVLSFPKSGEFNLFDLFYIERVFVVINKSKRQFVSIIVLFKKKKTPRFGMT